MSGSRVVMVWKCLVGRSCRFDVLVVVLGTRSGECDLRLGAVPRGF